MSITVDLIDEHCSNVSKWPSCDSHLEANIRDQCSWPLRKYLWKWCTSCRTVGCMTLWTLFVYNSNWTDQRRVLILIMVTLHTRMIMINNRQGVVNVCMHGNVQIHEHTRYGDISLDYACWNIPNNYSILDTHSWTIIIIWCCSLL